MTWEGLTPARIAELHGYTMLTELLRTAEKTNCLHESLSRRNASESLSLAGGLPALCFIGYLFAIWLGIRNIVLRSVELAGSYQQTACDVYDLIQKKWTRCLQETFGCLDICGQEDHMICSEKDFQTL